MAHLELGGRLQGAAVGGGGDPLLQRLQEDPLEVQHLRQAAEQALHLKQRCTQPLAGNRNTMEEGKKQGMDKNKGAVLHGRQAENAVSP